MSEKFIGTHWISPGSMPRFSRAAGTVMSPRFFVEFTAILVPGRSSSPLISESSSTKICETSSSGVPWVPQQLPTSLMPSPWSMAARSETTLA